MNRRVNNADITGFYLNIPNHNLKSFKLRFDNGNQASKNVKIRLTPNKLDIINQALCSTGIRDIQEK